MIHPLHDYVGYRILQIHRAHRNRAETALNKIGLYTGQEMLLFQLWQQEGLTQSELAEILCVGAPTMTKSLKRLEQAGLVERKQDEEDARVFRVYLTPRGKELEAPVRKIWEELEAVTVQGLNKSDEGQLRRLLEWINANLS